MLPLKFTRRVWFSVACLLGIATVAFGLWYNHRPCRVNKCGFAAICDGMTRDKVEGVFGRPPGDYTIIKGVYFRCSPSHANAAIYLGWTWEEWISDEGWITLTFDREGKVIDKKFRAVDDLPDRPFLEWAERFYRQGYGRKLRRSGRPRRCF
jgi:hypothetical protein